MRCFVRLAAVSCRRRVRRISPASKPESSMPGGGVADVDASVAEIPANLVRQAGTGFRIPVAPVIAACGMLLAVLAGIAVTVIDYPLQQMLGARHSLAWAPAFPVAPAAPSPVSSPASLPPEASVSAPPSVPEPPSAAAPSVKHGARPARLANAGKAKTKAKPVAVVAAGHRPAAPGAAPSIDDSYQAIVKKECRPGFFGILCGESVRWRLCDGRWNEGDKPGETRCQLGRKSGAGWTQTDSGLG